MEETCFGDIEYIRAAPQDELNLWTGDHVRICDLAFSDTDFKILRVNNPCYGQQATYDVVSLNGWHQIDHVPQGKLMLPMVGGKSCSK